MLGPGIEEARHVVEQVVAQVQGLMPESLELVAGVVSVDPDQSVEKLLEF
jgi:serine/threonine-protein kinase